VAKSKYIPGDFWRIDDRSGFKIRSSDSAKEWTGLIVRKRDWEPRHPQDFVRGRVDHQNVPEPRPEPAAAFVNNTHNLPLLTEQDGDDITIFTETGLPILTE